MADVQPFRAFRYNLARVGALEDVMAPPYDVIDPVLQKQLHDRHPSNVVRLILGYETPEDNDGDNRATCRENHSRPAPLGEDGLPNLSRWRVRFACHL